MLKSAFTQKDTGIKQIINLQQNKNHIKIHGKLSESKYKIKKLWLSSDEDIEGVCINNNNCDNNFDFDFNIKDYPKIISKNEITYNAFIIINIDEEELTEKEIEKFKKKKGVSYYEQKGIYEYPMRLGKFNQTYTASLIPTKCKSFTCSLYKTINGNVSLIINAPIIQRNITEINKFKAKKNIIEFSGKLFTRSQEVENVLLLLQGRENNQKVFLPVKLKFLTQETIENFGLNRYAFFIKLNMNEVVKNHNLESDIYDVYFNITFQYRKETLLIRVGNPSDKAKRYLKTAVGLKKETAFSFSPYYTVKRFNLSLETEVYKKRNYNFLKRVQSWVWLLRLFYKRKKIWIIGEKPYKAQDTGYRLFEFIRENYPTKNCYYVIDKNSPELKNIEPLGNILFYKSKKHILYTLMAKRIISSHHPDYIYPLRSTEFMEKVKAKKVFIQHGILGTKNIEHFYSKHSSNFSTDLFLVSSELEKKIVVDDLGYQPAEVKVTGLSRFDSLFKQDITLKKQLLIIPTWREWLVRDEVFLESEYYERYKTLVYSERLSILSKKYNFNIIFCLHPNMQKFSHYFENAPVTVINQGDINVQDLLKESAIMVTDYSSVAFDFSLLHKPIVYYQFDRSRFIGKKGSHLDLDNDLPGDIAYKLNDVISFVEKYAHNEFKNEEKNIIKAKRFIKYEDQYSSQRIVNAIENDIPK